MRELVRSNKCSRKGGEGKRKRGQGGQGFFFEKRTKQLLTYSVPPRTRKVTEARRKSGKNLLFVKQKRAKKLYSFGIIVKSPTFARTKTNKSFLLLFFKKEGLASLHPEALPACPARWFFEFSTERNEYS
jgi:hypothetical protein